MRIIILAFTVFILNACSSNNYYRVTPVDNPHKLAILEGNSKGKGLFDSLKFTIESVDGKFVSNFYGNEYKEVRLTPGAHKITIYSKFDRKLVGTCPCEARIPMTANFRNYNEYVVNGKVEDNVIAVWIENRRNGKKVSRVYKQPYVSSPKG